MNKILDILRIPLIKFIGIGAILYFALFSNKENPESLGNRLSKEEVGKTFNEAKNKSRFIISTVNTAQEGKEVRPNQPNPMVKITIEDLEIGKGENVISCGSEVEIAYGIYGTNNKTLKTVSSEKLTIGSALNRVVEQNIIGMKSGGIRNINIPNDLKSNDQKINDMLNFYHSDLRYQISVTSVDTNTSTQTSCQ
jgi:hypothetical protein